MISCFTLGRDDQKNIYKQLISEYFKTHNLPKA